MAADGKNFARDENISGIAVDIVREMFKRAGGYREFSELVEQNGLSGHWHVFREAQTRAVLGAWCEQHGLQLAEAELPN